MLKEITVNSNFIIKLYITTFTEMHVLFCALV